MVREHVGPIESLRGAVQARRLLWFFCRWCGHAERYDPRSVAYRTARDLTFGELARRLKCRRCGTQGKALVFVSEHGFPER